MVAKGASRGWLYDLREAIYQFYVSEENNRIQGSLADIPLATLYQNLQPIMDALERIDAEKLLDLQLSDHGPILREG